MVGNLKRQAAMSARFATFFYPCDTEQRLRKRVHFFGQELDPVGANNLLVLLLQLPARHPELALLPHACCSTGCRRATALIERLGSRACLVVVGKQTASDTTSDVLVSAPFCRPGRKYSGSKRICSYHFQTDLVAMNWEMLYVILFYKRKHKIIFVQ